MGLLVLYYIRSQGGLQAMINFKDNPKYAEIEKKLADGEDLTANEEMLFLDEMDELEKRVQGKE